MRLKLFLVLLGVGGMVFSAHKVYVVLTNRQPARMSCAEFIRSGSSAKWVELTGCELDVENAIGLQSRVLKVDKGLYIPVRPAGETGTPPILLKTNDDDPSVGIRQEPVPDSGTPAESSGPPALATISGMVQSGLDGDRKSRKALDKLAREGVVRQDYLVIEAGEKPDMGDLVTGVSLLIVIPLIAWVVWRGRSRTPPAAAGAPPFPPAGPPPPMPPLPPAPR